jgi:hypothetical protein
LKFKEIIRQIHSEKNKIIDYLLPGCTVDILYFEYTKKTL